MSRNETKLEREGATYVLTGHLRELNYKCSTKDKILDWIYLKFELRSICTEIVYSLLHFLTKGMEGRV